MLLKVFVFTSLSLQFNFRVHTGILIKQYLLLIIFFSKYQSLSLPVLEAKCAWNLHFLPIHLLISLSAVISPTFFNFPRRFELSIGSRMLYYILSWLPVLIVVSFWALHHTWSPFVLFNFTGIFLYLIYLLVKQSVKNELEKSMVFTKIS